VPDPGDPIADTPSNTFRRFYGTLTAYQIPTAGGAVVDVHVPGPDGGLPSWHCQGCGASEAYGGDAAELSTMVAAGTHAVGCGHDVAAVLDAEIDAVKAEATRVDPKAAGYLQVAGILASAGFAVLATNSRHLPGPAVIAGVLAAVLVLTAVVLLLLASRPNLGGGTAAFGFMGYAEASDATTILARLTGPQSPLTPLHQARELWWRSRLLRAKYTRIRWAVPLLIAGFLGAAATAAIAAWTAIN
jgi:hypothetical protein